MLSARYAPIVAHSTMERCFLCVPCLDVISRTLSEGVKSSLVSYSENYTSVVMSWQLRHGDSSGTHSKKNIRHRNRYQATTGEETVVNYLSSSIEKIYTDSTCIITYFTKMTYLELYIFGEALLR
jgi:hypothetical protein